MSAVAGLGIILNVVLIRVLILFLLLCPRRNLVAMLHLPTYNIKLQLA